MSRIALLLSVLAFLSFPAFREQERRPSRPPNFIVIMGEAQGWNSTSVQMDDQVPESKSKLVVTPNLERLAKEGMRFSSAYAASPRCTPSRASFLTGKSPALLHMTYVGQGKDAPVDPGRKLLPPRAILDLPESEVTIAELLRDAGYATAHFGKWHVGRANPSRHGFVENDGPNNNGGPDNEDSPNPKQTFATAALGADFIARQAKAGKPFYLQISEYGGKGIEDVRKETWEAVQKRGPRNERQLGIAAVTEDMDAAIGQILKKLDELGIADNTYVIYTADHGTPGRNSNQPLSNGKGSLQEGGIRVPLIIKGPGISSAVCSHTRVAAFDLLPTMVELAGLKVGLPSGIEGGSLVSVLRGDGRMSVRRKQQEMVFHFPHYDLDNDGPASIIFQGDLKAYKSYETGALRLYDIRKDPSELKDLAAQFPEKLKELDSYLVTYLKSVNAQMPEVNQSYDPSKEPTIQRGGRRKKDGEQ